MLYDSINELIADYTAAGSSDPVSDAFDRALEMERDEGRPKTLDTLHRYYREGARRQTTRN